MNHTGGIREHDPWTERLSEYVDGELPRHEREALQRHVGECPRCAATLAELRAVLARAQALDDPPPAEDLWPGIEAQIAAAAARRRAPVPLSFPDWWQRRLDLSLPQLAAAGLLLAGLTAAGMWLLMNRAPLRDGGSPGATSPPIAALDRAPADATAPAGTANDTRERGPEELPVPSRSAPSRTADDANVAGASPAPAGDAVVATYASGSPRYDQAVAELEQALAAGRGRLEPRTLRVLEENLRTIDRAIADARRAVEADPANAWLREHLTATMKRKVDLLRTATMLAAEQG